VNWYINGTAFSAASFPNSSIGNELIDGTYFPVLRVSELDVTDYATIRCDFIQENEVKCSAYVGIDDMQDPEFMYIQFNGANGNAASLRKGQSVTFDIFVGKRDDATIDTAYSVFKVLLLNSDGNEISDNDLGGTIPNTESNVSNWRIISNRRSNMATIEIPYTVVKTYGKNLTGIVLASTSA